ncbi:MAG: a-factor receptor [Sclerophora amabilis]|nr:MAG: a-factor receptor [Sclerophora amabilis]
MDPGLEPVRSPAAVILPILALFSIFLSIPPFTWHLKNRNIAACSLIFWITLANVFVFINALIWPTDDVKRWWNGVGLCDVEVKLTFAFSLGAAGSLTCIMKNLAKIMDVDRTVVIPTRAQRRRQVVVDVLWCYAGPIYLIAVDYVVQFARYYIFTISGCTPAVDNSWLTVFLIFIWSPIFCIIGGFYSGCGFLLFLFFGTGNDAMKMYRGWLLKIGLGRFFPSLMQSRASQAGSSTSASGRFGSLSSRAKLIFRKGSQAGTSASSCASPSDLTWTELGSPSPADPRATFESSIRIPGSPARPPPTFSLSSASRRQELNWKNAGGQIFQGVTTHVEGGQRNPVTDSASNLPMPSGGVKITFGVAQATTLTERRDSEQ